MRVQDLIEMEDLAVPEFHPAYLPPSMRGGTADEALETLLEALALPDVPKPNRDERPALPV
jgi:hypothetical protein